MAHAHLVGLIADTHDNRASVEKSVALFNRKEVGLVVHAGDFIAPFNARWMADLNAPMVGVFGNNDGERFGLRAQFESLGPIHRAPHAFDCEGRRLLVMHEPDEVDALAESGAYDVIVYGHTHEIDVRHGDTLVVNPGEAGGWVTGRCTVGLLDLENLQIEIVDI
ncbi:MAG: metallophosphoesterase [Candidatus Latescibacteria bacterium]|nr:metallophosphoesterase [Candidatus Latescibacterota bacterium]